MTLSIAIPSLGVLFMKKHDEFAYHLNSLYDILSDYLEHTEDLEDNLDRIAMLHTYIAIDTLRQYAFKTPFAVQFFNNIRNQCKSASVDVGLQAN